MRELSEHVLDILYNSLEAGARAVRVEVTEDSRADRITLCMSDDGRGMDPEEVRRVSDPFFTTRTTRRVGLGIPLLAQAARACDGGIEIDSRPGEGTAVTAWLQASHIDRQPLGDMAATLVTVIAGSPDVEVEYRHRVDGREFAFTTRQMREELGDVPLSNPAVVQWLREYLKENIPSGGGIDE